MFEVNNNRPINHVKSTNIFIANLFQVAATSMNAVLIVLIPMIIAIIRPRVSTMLGAGAASVTQVIH